jgi:murein DD-endopeptidase MepM/ murein hydrolase activator NlpD
LGNKNNVSPDRSLDSFLLIRLEKPVICERIFLTLPPQPTAPNRTVPVQRVNKIRFSWFVLGTTLGSIVTSVLSNLVIGYPATQVAQNMPQVPVMEQQHAAQTPQAVTPQIQTIDSPEASPAAAPAPVAKPKLTLPASLNLKIQRGDTLSEMLTEVGVSMNEATDVVDSIRSVHNPRRLTAGGLVALKLDASKADPNVPTVKELKLSVSAIKSVKVTRKGDKFVAEAVNAPLVKAMARGGGVITSSLYQTGANAGIPAPILTEVIQAMSYDVDFQRDVKEGDRLDVLYERMQTEAGVPAGYGDVIYAAITVNGKKKEIFRHETKDGTASWYNGLGESIRKALLKTPINGARISSGFGMRRHPILGYSKMHRGVDFAAATGTPILAAGDGVVKFAGRQNGYGNIVEISHGNKYSTRYAHASRIAKGIREGTKVKQGQIIAYVGSTGRSTGPHLHYEILANNVQVNPTGVKFKTGQSLSGKELAAFKKNVDKIEVALDKIPLNKSLAMIDVNKTR